MMKHQGSEWVSTEQLTAQRGKKNHQQQPGAARHRERRWWEAGATAAAAINPHPFVTPPNPFASASARPLSNDAGGQVGEIIVCHSERSKTICCQFPPCCTVTSKQALAYEDRVTVPCLLADGASVAPRPSPSIPMASDCCPGQQLEN